MSPIGLEKHLGNSVIDVNPGDAKEEDGETSHHLHHPEWRQRVVLQPEIREIISDRKDMEEEEGKGRKQ